MSAKALKEKELWEFGPFRLDTRARLLFREGVPVSLTPKAFEVLAYLVRNEGRAVPRQELLDAIWPETVVTDATLTQAVFLIRKALGEPEMPRVLDTVPRVGYRLNLPGTAGKEATEAPADAAPGSVRAEESIPDAVADPGEGAGGPPLQSDAGELSNDGVVPAPGARGSGATFRGRPFLVPIIVAVVLLLAGISPFLWERRDETGSRGSAPLLTVERQIAVPPDAIRVLGVIDKTVVLLAPGAFYLLPSDGALAAVRVPLAEGEVAVWPLVADRLITVKGRRVLFRNPAGTQSGEFGELPAGAVAAQEGRVVASRSGRFLSLRDSRVLEVFERRGETWGRCLRVEADWIEGEVLAVTERYAALAQGRGLPVRVWSLPEGESVLEAPFAERQVSALAVDDARGSVAVGGPFDSVAVFPLGMGRSGTVIPVRGWTLGLEWVPDSPTLIVSGLMGVRALREGKVVADLSDLGAAGGVHLDSDFLGVLLPKEQRLAILTYSGFRPVARVHAGGRPLWAAEHDASGRSVFAGGRDGHLWVLDTGALQIRQEEAHTDGIPSLFRHGDLLASSSDDKTVGIWKLPGPRLSLRTRTHEFLVNDLTVVESGDGYQLVTSSSDGTIKRWSWPGLAELETIDVQKLLGRPVSFHGVWSEPGARRILAGTWNSSLLDLSTDGVSWRVTSHPVGSRAVYRLAALPRLGLVVAVGIMPSEISVFDLSRGRLWRIDDAGLDAMWVVAVPGSDEAVVVGRNGVSRYAFSRVGGSLDYSIWSGRETGAGLQTATLLPGGKLWAGTVGGELLLYELEALSGPPLVTRTVPLSRAR